MKSKGKSLLEAQPQIASEWHPHKNGKLLPSNVLQSSSIRVWWLCNSGHEWEAVVGKRVGNKSGCPYCFGRGVTKKLAYENSLAFARPDIAVEWDNLKNDGLTPKDVFVRSSKKVWWICKNNHEWQAIIGSRTDHGAKGRCPFCSNKKVHLSNCLETRNPELSSQWHPTMNSISPSDVTPGSALSVWWICNKGHVWKCKIVARNAGSECPRCKLKTSKVQVRVFSEINKLFPDAILSHRIDHCECDIFIQSLNVAIEVDGRHWHHDKRDLAKNQKLKKHGVEVIRIRDVGLKKLSHWDIVANLQNLQPLDIKNLLSSLVEYFNVPLEKFDGYKANEFIADDEYRKITSELPRKIHLLTLAIKSPSVALEWHPTKNFPLTPYDFTSGSSQRVWWVCNNGHEWQASIALRASTRHYGCPYCTGRFLDPKRTLAHVRPDVASQWHPEKNGDLLPENIAPKSSKHVWWKCSNGHEWIASVQSRINAKRPAKCPVCSGTRKIGERYQKQ